MSLFCKWFGHKRLESWRYVELDPYHVDGINRGHAFLYARCDRCDKKYVLAKTHVYAEVVERSHKQYLQRKEQNEIRNN